MSNPSLSLDVFGKTEAAGQRGVGEEGDLVDLAAAQGEHHHASGLRAQVVAEGRLAVGAGRAYLERGAADLGAVVEERADRLVSDELARLRRHGHTSVGTE